MQKDNLEGFHDLKKRQRDSKCSIGFAMTVIGSKWRAISLWHTLKQPPIRSADCRPDYSAESGVFSYGEGKIFGAYTIRTM